MTSHLEESFQRDIDRLMRRVSESARLVQQGLDESLQALVEQKLQLAYLVILRDRRVDDLEKQIDRLCLEFLVRQQPVAQHLRLAYAIIKINTELERIGDYAESIARQALKLAKMESLPCAEDYRQIGKLAGTMLKQAMKSFTAQDAELARTTVRMDKEVDAIRNRIQTELLARAQQNQLPMDSLMPLMTVARRVERVADQAKNICEEVLYLCTGEYSKHKGTEATRILFVDQHNSCRSQMAEGVANSLNHPEFIFTSAGLKPQPLDSKTVAFMARKGIDISKNASKSVEQVPNLDHYQVIVALDKEATKVFPPPPTKTVCFDWTVPNPSDLQDSSETVEKAYEEAFRQIRENITSLIQAILGNEKDLT